jgi:uncharacterized membrane protein
VILAIIGLLFVALGLIYIIHGTLLPDFLQGSTHHGHHQIRATVSFVIAVIFFIAAWLTARRRPSSRHAATSDAAK